jgi:RNA polymerase sigma-70 factor, ECF subfamily
MSADEQLSDGPLVAKALAGHRDALDVLARRYRPALVRTAWSRLGRTEAAEDAVQETLLCVFKSLHTYDSRCSFRTWLWTILLNQCKRAAKKQARRADDKSFVRLESDAATSSLPLPGESLLAAERAAELGELLARLPEAQADALRLRFFGDLKFDEIAAAQGCTLSTAKYRVRSGLQQLSAWIGPSQNEVSVPPSTRPES